MVPLLIPKDAGAEGVSVPTEVHVSKTTEGVSNVTKVDSKAGGSSSKIPKDTNAEGVSVPSKAPINASNGMPGDSAIVIDSAFRPAVNDNEGIPVSAPIDIPKR